MISVALCKWNASACNVFKVLHITACPASHPMANTFRNLNISCPSLINCHRTSIVRLTSAAYCRMYPTLVVAADGSTTVIRFDKPRKIIQLPLDLATLTEAERQSRLVERKPKTKIILEEEVEDSFVVDKYAHLWK